MAQPKKKRKKTRSKLWLHKPKGQKKARLTSPTTPHSSLQKRDTSPKRKITTSFQRQVKQKRLSFIDDSHAMGEIEVWSEYKNSNQEEREDVESESDENEKTIFCQI